MNTQLIKFSLVCCVLQTQSLIGGELRSPPVRPGGHVAPYASMADSSVFVEPVSFSEGCCMTAEGCCDKAEGWLKHSDHRFNDFISPMTNPVFFEDPRTLTEARFIFMNHSLPSSLGGSSVQLYALQVRAALTERLSLIATKDGFVVSQNPLINDGWADVAAGLKYNIFSDPCSQQLLSIGATYELPSGTPRTLQGNGDGEFHLFATGGMEIADDVHLISGSGFRLPANSTAENQVWYWSTHVDRKIGRSGLYLFGESNWYHWMSSASAFGAPVEGGDLFNLGSVGVGGNDIVTGAIGIKLKPSPRTEIGVAWETHLTDRRGVMQDRLTVDWILRY